MLCETIEALDVLIRQAKQDDIAGLMRLYAQLNPDDPVVADGQYIAEFRKIVSSDHLFLFVGIAENEIIATCYLNIIPNLTRGVSPYGIIENVVTDSCFRNMGYGKVMVRHALDFAWSHRCYKVMLQTGSMRESTHRFYEACGLSANEKFAFVARST